MTGNEEPKLSTKTRDPRKAGGRQLLADPATLGNWLIESSPDCVKLVEADGTISFVNEIGACLLEVDSVDTVIGRTWSDMWPESGRATVSAAVISGFAGKPSRFSGACPTSRGTHKWWDVAVSPVRTEAGSVARLLCVSRDVTEQRAIEERLTVREQHFRALADNMAQLAWMADQSGHIFWYNKRWFDYTGTTLEQMLGSGWRRVHHPAHVDRVAAKIRDHFASGEAWEDVFPLRGADGEYRWFLSRALPIRDASGQIAIWCGTNTDVSEQRNASSRLRQKARLIEQSHEAILVWDFDSGIQTWNRGCEELYGYSRSEASGARVDELLGTRFPGDPALLERTLRETGSWSGELLHIAKGGGEVWVDSRKQLIHSEGRALVLETNRDITERRKADQMRSLLLAELDHRVKNTLSIVQSIAGQTARSSRDMSQFLRRFNERLQALSSAHNLLAEARWAGAELHDLIRAQWSDIGHEEISSVSLDGPPAFLPAQTALQLALIMFELASNALRHGALSRKGSARGAIDVSWRIEAGDPPRLVLRWRERGGPPATAPHVRGFGMTLIERLGGQPHLQAQVTFEPEGLVCDIVAQLPAPATGPQKYFDPGGIAVTAATPTARPQSDKAALHGFRVLIIEDEPLIAMSIEDMVQDVGMIALPAVGSVAGAMAAIRQSRFDVAILDGSLRGERVDAIVAELVAHSTPFVFVTGFTRENLPSGYGDVPVVVKPVTEAALMSALRAVI